MRLQAFVLWLDSFMNTPPSLPRDWILLMDLATSHHSKELHLSRSKRKGTRKSSEHRRIRDQRLLTSVKSQSEPFGIFSKSSIWKQFAEKHSGLRITVRDDSVHKGLRRRRGRRRWTNHPIMPRIHTFSSKSTIQSI